MLRKAPSYDFRQFADTSANVEEHETELRVGRRENDEQRF